MTPIINKDHIPKAYIKNMIEEHEKEIYKYIKSEPRKDSLTLIFQKQNQLSQYLSQSKPHNYYHHGKERYPYEKVAHLITAISSELEEIRNGLDYKWWKDYETTDLDLITYNEEEIEENSPLMEKILDKGVEGKPFLTDEQRATQKQILENSKLEYLQKEIVDVWHFLVQMSIEVKLDPKKLVEMYLDKNSENIRRQDQNY